MNRRLNPELFSSNTEQSQSSNPSPSIASTRKLELELSESKKRISHLESLVEVIQLQMKAMNETGNKRTEAFSKALSSLEKDLREQDLVRGRKLQQLENRMRDQKIVDGQIESMVDRFNTSLSQFENKLSSLQKVISEKEMTLMSYRRVMEQIVDEVEKIKIKQNNKVPQQFL
jgi:hypothetical protein